MKKWAAAFSVTLICVAASPAAEGFIRQVESEPKETYYAFHTALRNLDMEKVRARWLPKESIADDEKAITNTILQMHQVVPPEVEVLNQRISGQNAFLKVMGYYPNGGKSEGTVYLVRTIDRWRVRDQEWGFIQLPPPPPKPKGEGIIEGIVTLPPVQDTGDLYLFAVMVNELYPTAYIRIPKDQIAWKTVPYQIPALPKGRYWVTAYWDTALPYMDPEKNDFSVYTGDYAGEFLTSVTVGEGEIRNRIDFACNRNLKGREEENFGTVYAFVDLGIGPGEGGKPLFVLSVRNTGDKPVRNVSLNCRINGKDLSYIASSPGPLILPQKIQEFDITSCYESYIFFLEKVWTEESLSRENLNFEIVSKDNGAQLTKTLTVK